MTVYNPGAAAAAQTTAANDTIYDAKGDVVGGTGSDAAARLAIGANDLTLTADSTTATGLAWKNSLPERKRRLWMPSAISGVTQASIVDETIPHSLGNTAGGQATGTMRCYGNLMVPAGVSVNKVACYAAVAGSGFSNQWVCLLDVASTPNVLVKSADKTTEAWGSSTWKVFTLASTYTPSVDTAVCVGLVIVATGMPTHPIASQGTGLTLEVPRIGFNSTTGLTDPASLGGTATVGALTNLMYCALAT